MEQNNNFHNGNFQNGNFQNGNFQNGNIQNMNYQNGNIQGNTALNNDQQYAGQPYMANHSPMLNGQPMSTNMMAAEMEKQENVALGIIGAIGGSLIGVVVMVLLYYANTVAAIAGIAMIICAVKGYEKLSGRFSTRGVIISAIVTIAMVYVGARFCFAIALTEAYKGYNVFEAFVEAGEKVATNPALAKYYNRILIEQYIFAGIGIVVEAISLFTNKNGKTGIGAFRK